MNFDPVSFAIGKKAGGDPPAGSAATPDMSIAANPALTASGGDIVASVSASESITPTVVPGYVSTGTPGTVTASGSTTVAATELDANLVVGNIKEGVTIFGVTGSLTLPQLNAPAISLSGDTLTIANPATNGNFVTGYKIYSGETLLATVQTTSVDLSQYISEAGTYTITAKTYGTGFADSAASGSVTYTVTSVYTVNLNIDYGDCDAVSVTYNGTTYEAASGQSPLETSFDVQPNDSLYIYMDRDATKDHCIYLNGSIVSMGCDIGYTLTVTGNTTIQTGYDQSSIFSVFITMT